MKFKSLMLILVISFVLFIVGCNQQTILSSGGIQSNEQTTSLNEQKQVTTKQPPELILTLSDLGEGYTTKERTPRLKSDVSEEGILWGWKDGYYVRYARVGENIFDVTVIEHWISIYPMENVGKNLEQGEESNENVTYEELPSPNIGDKSKAWRVTSTDSFGESNRYYKIEFIKMNVYERLDISGTTTDYEILKTLARKVETKIK